MKGKGTKIAQLVHQTSAASTVETALAFLLAIPTFFIAFELCILAYAQAVLSDSARFGVRYAIVHGTDSASCSGPSAGCGDQLGANITSSVQQYSAQFLKSLSNVRVTVSYPDASSAPPSRVQVTVNYTYVPVVAKAFASQTLKATSEGRIVF